MTFDAKVVAANVAAVRRRIADAGGEGRVRLIAVTKGFGADAVDAAVRAGVTDVGESYAQELAAKAPLVSGADVRWHFIGRLQTNKVRSVAEVVELWHTVDRVPLGEEVAKRAPGARVLVQVNVSDEPQKGGCSPRDVRGLVGRLRRLDLDVAGLMAIGATGAPEAARPGFRRLTGLAEELGLAERSMGMSGDLDVAVEEGSTMVRVGRALFGDRPRPDGPDPSH
jgi:pyridoxal phosphate enzyme (YggS family)